MDVGVNLTEYSQQVLSVVSSLSILTLITIAAIVVLMLISLKGGKENVVALILAVYIGFFMSTWFPWTSYFENAEGVLPPWVSLAIFGGCTLVAFIIVRRSMQISFEDGGARGWFDALLLSLSGVVLVLALLYTAFPLPNMPLFSPEVTSFLASEQLRFWWLLAPLAVVFITSRA